MISTHGVKYIGSKKTVNPHIVNLIQTDTQDIDTVIDVFTGTTRVAQALRQIGKAVTTSDMSWASEAYAHTFIHNKHNLHLAPYIVELNNLVGYDGWLTTNYCDVRTANNDVVRMWKPKNGKRADAIRDKIDTYDLEHWEKMTLITSLIFAMDDVDNSVGVQQAYLKDWCARSKNNMALKLPPMVWHPFIDTQPPTAEHIVGDALRIEYPHADLAYLDPPYSPHQYSTYYHIWDSVVRWDKPEVALKTNRRIDRTGSNNTMISAWNQKDNALDAFGTLIKRLNVRYVMVSYSSDSIIPIDNLIELCNTIGNTTIKVIDYKRNIMHKIGNKSNTALVDSNQELLILIEKKT